MAYNTRPLKRAQDGVAPQYYNRTVDEYEVLEGTAGANHVVIYGPDGQPASLATETKLEAVRALLALLEGKDFATDTKAEAIRLLLASLDGKDFASETTLAAMETELGLAKTELAAIKGMLTDGTAKGEVTLSGNIVASETLFPEETRAATTGYSTLQSCPNGARGFAISLTIWGVTGTFGSGEGVGLYVRIRNDADRILFTQLTEKTNVLNCCHVVTMYPGLQEAPLPVTGNRLVHINAFSIGSVDAQIQVTGTFGSGEGVVCSAKVIWLL